jgi:arabinofuranosyltransferase
VSGRAPGTPARHGAGAGYLFVSALFLLAAHAAWLSGFTVDDAYISFRYARNLAAGLGPVFNAGERVEGYSNPVYTFVLAGFAALTTRPEWIPQAGRVLGLVSALGTLTILALGIPGLKLRPGPLLASLLLATSTSFALWAVAGLETPVYALCVTAAFALTLARPDSGIKRFSMGVLLALITLSRPEGALIAAVFVLWRLLDPKTRGDQSGHAEVLIAAALPVLAYLGFRFFYFGDWLPNTFYAKDGPIGRSYDKGLWYLVSFVHWNGGKWLYAAAPLVLLSRESRGAGILAGLVLAAQAAFIFLVGGDWMDQHRFLSPFLPLVFLVVAQGWAVLGEAVIRPLRKWPGGRFPGFVRFLGLALVWLTLVYDAWPRTNQQKENGYVNASPYYEAIGKAVAVAARPEWTVATHDIGAIGWYGKTKVLDLLGLVDPTLARNKAGADELIALRNPEIVILHYDNRNPPEARWRLVETADFENRYAVPLSPVELPGSFRVRRDLLPEVQARLHGMPRDLRTELAALSGYLAVREPDGQARGPASP